MGVGPHNNKATRSEVAQWGARKIRLMAECADIRKKERILKLGMAGLGRMGANMALRLMRGGHEIVAYDPNPEAVRGIEGQGASGVASLDEMVERLALPRAVWIMAPAGEPTETTISTLHGLLSSGDIIIDGGNAYYKDSIRRAEMLGEKGIRFLDVGTSGGVWGLEEGYCLMVGGDESTYNAMLPGLETLAPRGGLGLGKVGPAGAGHFVKMVHNAVEYGLMQAYAEGFELMSASDKFDINLEEVAEIWRHGSVVRSWLLDLATRALKEDPGLEGIRAYVEDTGEGRWAVQESVDLSVPVPVIAASLQARFRSRQEEPLGARLLAALRKGFGGHQVLKSGDGR